MNMMGIRVRAKRKEMGLTQKQLADAVGVTREFITAFEAGYKCPSVYLLAQIADKLNVSMDYLTKGEEHERA